MGSLLPAGPRNSKYAFLGAIRSAAQMVAYEIAMGFALVGVLMASGSLNLGEIVLAQSGSILHWFWLPLLPLFFGLFLYPVWLKLIVPPSMLLRGNLKLWPDFMSSTPA